MAFRFAAKDLTVADGVRRIAAGEYAAIEAVLTDPATPAGRKVHECRKATKRLRALLRLTVAALPEARAEINALRDAAASLSALRDKGALGETLARLEMPAEIEARIAKAISRRRAVSAAESRRLLAAFADDMASAAARVPGWTFERDGWRAIGPGLERGYRRFAGTLADARNARDEEPVHDLRKRAKDHWYQTLLLRNIFPDVMEGHAAAGERLCDDLGDWRDLGLLETEVGQLTARQLPAAQGEEALARIARARRRALRRALRTARRLASESPDAYTARLRSWWRLSR
jgi:CHAD domain-containing protein